MTFDQIVLGIFEGFRVTGSVTLISLLYAVPFALALGILQYLTTGAARLATTAVIEFWRSSPVLVLLFAFYYTLPLFGVTLSAMVVAPMVLGLNIGGYGSQAVRAALQALDRGQVEAGLALGLTRATTLVSVELPQALRAMIPTFINLLIQLIKSTSLVSLITLTDMTYRTKEISQIEFNPLPVYSALIVCYLLVCYPVTILGRYAERRLANGRSVNHAV